jgi:hypothetical protein
MNPVQYAAALVFVAQTNAALARAFRAAETVAGEHPQLSVEVYLDQPIALADPRELPSPHFLIMHPPSGVSRGGDLSPGATTFEMTRDLGAVAREVAAEIDLPEGVRR